MPPMKRQKHQTVRPEISAALPKGPRALSPATGPLLSCYRGIRGAATLGLLSALYLTWHYKLFLSGAGDQALCNVSQVINCDRIAASEWSRLFGLPLAAWGVGGYVALIAHTTKALRRAAFSRERGGPSDYVFSTLLLILPFAAGLAILPTVSLVQVRALCLGCAVSWIADLGLLLFGILLFKRARALGPAPRALRLLWPSLALGALALALLAWYARPSASPPPEEAKPPAERPRVPLETGDLTAIDSLTPVLGNPAAPITIVYFTDFQCPYCKLQTEALKELLARRPRAVRVIYRHYPLDHSCNLRLTRTAHPYACQLARLAMEAHRRGLFQEWSQEIWRAQESLTPERIREIAERYGLDLARAEQDAEIRRRLAQDISLAERSGVDSTPTLILQGRLLRGYQPVERLESFVSALLAQGSGPEGR